MTGLGPLKKKAPKYTHNTATITNATTSFGEIDWKLLLTDAVAELDEDLDLVLDEAVFVVDDDVEGCASMSLSLDE